MDLPNKEERKEILNIQIKNKGRNPENFDIDTISGKCDEFTGAEIEEAVVSALFNSYADNERELADSDLVEAIENIKPASKGIMSATVNQLRDWAKDKGIKNANSAVKEEKEDVSKKVSGGRRIFTEGGN